MASLSMSNSQETTSDTGSSESGRFHTKHLIPCKQNDGSVAKAETYKKLSVADEDEEKQPSTFTPYYYRMRKIGIAQLVIAIVCVTVSVPLTVEVDRSSTGSGIWCAAFAAFAQKRKISVLLAVDALFVIPLRFNAGHHSGLLCALDVMDWSRPRLGYTTQGLMAIVLLSQFVLMAGLNFTAAAMKRPFRIMVAFGATCIYFAILMIAIESVELVSGFETNTVSTVLHTVLCLLALLEIVLTIVALVFHRRENGNLPNKIDEDTHCNNESSHIVEAILDQGV